MAGHIPTAVSCDWCTEDRIIKLNDRVFGKKPDLDPCSNPYSRVGAKHEFMLQNGRDGLVDSWFYVNGDDINDIFVNPPFGKGWWKPAHTDECLSSEYNVACICGMTKRVYIWPSDREAKMEQLKAQFCLEGLVGDALTKATKKAFDKWAADYTMVDIGDWIERCALAGVHKNTIGLLPSYPETQAWFNDVWPRARALAFPKGRLHFRLVYTLPDGTTVEKTGPAPMACALPLWTPDDAVVARFDNVYSEIGKVVLL